MTAQIKTPPVRTGLESLLTGRRRERDAGGANNSGCDFTTRTDTVQYLPQVGANPPIDRPQGGSAIAIRRVNPEQTSMPSGALKPAPVKTVLADTLELVGRPGRRTDADKGDGWASSISPSRCPKGFIDGLLPEKKRVGHEFV
jgi:hypothetical protein